MNYGWHDRPSKASVKHHIDGDEPAVVYSVGKYDVTVPGDEVAVTYRCPYYSVSMDPRRTLPNMEIADGEIRIPVVDLVDEVLTRLDPVELARALWQNDDVKAEFIDCMVTRWSQQGIDDGDRRKALHGVKEAVHSAALDKLASAAAAMEYAVVREANHHDEVRRINDVLRDLDVRVNRTVWEDGKATGTESVVLQFDSREQREKTEAGNWTYGQFEVGGRVWNEARKFWREKVLEQFPTSPTPEG